MKGAFFLLVLLCLAMTTPLVRAQEAEQSEREAMYSRYLEFASYVKGGKIEPHWMADGSSFWYAEGAPANTVIYKVDPKNNTKEPMFDTARLRQALTPLLGHEPPYQGLPFERFTFVDKSEKRVKFAVAGKGFILELDTYTIVSAPASEEEKSRLVPQTLPNRFRSMSGDLWEELSPDSRWFAALKDHNVWLRSTYDGRGVQITTDGVEDYQWGDVGWEDETRWVLWSPDSLKLAIKKVDGRGVPKVPVVHWLKPEEEVEWVPVPKAGGALPQTELFIVDIASKRAVRVDIGKERDQYIFMLAWLPDGSELLFVRVGREYKKLDLMAANPRNGATRTILTETSETFVRHPPWGRGIERDLTLLKDKKSFTWISERDGWHHVYLFELDGSLIRRLTEGTFPVVHLVAVDEESGWVYFTAHGDQERPYDTHLYRVTLEGKGFTRLTEAPGQHDIQFSPSNEFFVDTHSTVARPPVVELRRADSMLLQTLAKANIDSLKELRWSPPEEFVVKAADGKTDLYGLLSKPYDFDPNKKYPVIELIYAGPQITHVPRTFVYWGGEAEDQALAQLGFIVVNVDGRGTPERGKQFQDVVYGNFGRHEIPDHVAALKQLAERRPYMDLSRVGIYGHSWGGYFAIRAMLLAPDVYHVGIARAPSVDVAFEAYYEPYMGLPQKNKEGYEYASSLPFVGNLKGKLLLVHGTSDINVPFSHTMKMVEALIRAGKPYDLVILPEQPHGLSTAGYRYWLDALRRYFQEHLKP